MGNISPEFLNELYVLLHRSLLQYVGECWPWTAEDGAQDGASGEIRKAISAQKQDEERIASLLTGTDWIVNHGGFPTQYTDLHYVSLTYLLKQLVDSQSVIVQVIEKAVFEYPAEKALQEILESERAILKTVQSLATSQKTATMIY